MVSRINKASFASLMALSMIVACVPVSSAAVKQQTGRSVAARHLVSRGSAEVPGSALRSRTGPGSFVPYKAESIEALVEQLNNNQSVANRYARHFGTAPDKLKQYFLNNLKLVRLEKPQKVTTYFISKHGTIMSRTCMLPKGTRTFATSDGKAILEWRCGNPLTRRLPPHGTPIKLTTKEVPDVKVAPFAQEIGTLPPILTPEVLTLASAPVAMVPTIEPMVETIAAPPVAFPPILSALAPLLLGAVAVQHSQPSPEVPEPSTLFALWTFVSGSLVVYRSRKRSI